MKFEIKSQCDKQNLNLFLDTGTKKQEYINIFFSFSKLTLAVKLNRSLWSINWFSCVTNLLLSIQPFTEGHFEYNKLTQR